MKAYHRAGFVGFIGAVAAEEHGVRHACGFESGGDRVGDFVLVGADVIVSEIGRQQDVGGTSAGEGFGQSGGVRDVGLEDFCAENCESLETTLAAADDAHLLTAVQKSFCYNFSRVSCGSENDVHVSSLPYFCEYDARSGAEDTATEFLEHGNFDAGLFSEVAGFGVASVDVAGYA